MERYDVVVVGAGLAGLCCARWLGEAGRTVLLVDRKSRLDQAIHTTGIFVRRTLEDFALPEDCLGPPVRDVKLYSPQRRVIVLSSHHDEFRVGKMGRLYSHLLDAAIRKGVVWRPATSFLRTTPEGDGRLVEFETQGQRQSVHTRYVIGADGANSRVARDLGLSQNDEWIVGVEQVYDSHALEMPPCLHCFLDPRLAPGYIGWLAHDGEEMHLGVGGYGNRFDPNGALDQLREELSQSFPLARAELVEQRGGRIPVGGLLREIVNEQGLVVGDAAGAVSPLTAGGLDPCLRQSAIAVEVTSAFLDSGDAAQLSPYQSAPLRRRFRLRCLLRRVFSQVDKPWMAEAAFATLRMFPFNRFARHIFFSRSSFPLRGDEHLPRPAYRGAS
jgi:flavin-dependent dehydrogenase